MNRFAANAIGKCHAIAWLVATASFWNPLVQPADAIPPEANNSRETPAASASPTARRGATPQDVLQLVSRQAGRLAFKGVRVQQVIRQDMVLNARARVEYLSPGAHQFALDAPKELEGLNMLVENRQLSILFPGNGLLFQGDVPEMADEARDLVLGTLLLDQAALQRNYRLTVDEELDIVSLYPCYKLTAEPIKGYGVGQPPGHRFWIAKENGAILKEERFWGPAEASYFLSHFENFSTSRKPVLKLEEPKGVNKLKLAKGSPAQITRYANPDQAKADKKTIFLPKEPPAQFALRAVEVMSLYGTDLVFLRYDNGLARVVVTYRTKPNFFLTLLAGAFALALVDKISALSYHAPNNYAVVEKGDYLVYAYGDLYVESLKAIANSVPIPVGPSGNKQVKALNELLAHTPPTP
ncbi:MAG: hypothetical protein VKN33_00540 [Candidatus Sericytochromatia bacterium]|nr:hypothetical protein [Candidatus Sericytochromatia bacterium]